VRYVNTSFCLFSSELKQGPKRRKSSTGTVSQARSGLSDIFSLPLGLGFRRSVLRFRRKTARAIPLGLLWLTAGGLPSVSQPIRRGVTIASLLLAVDDFGSDF
jgi:hypothetical protein